MEKEIKDIISENISVNNRVLDEMTEDIGKFSNLVLECYKKNKKLLVCGNGGSAADAQHISGELVGRFKLERKGIPCIALSTDSSVMTAWSNDYEFDTIFSRQVEALGNKGDILIGISTSGNSKNVIKAIEKAKEKGLTAISLTGKDGGKIREISDFNINVNHDNTPRVQEAHMLIYHIMCELVEAELFK